MNLKPRILEILREQDVTNERIQDLDKKIARLEGIDRDGTLASLKEELATTQNTLDDFATRIEDLQRKEISLNLKISEQQGKYNRELEKHKASSPILSLIQRSERIRNVIDTVIPKLFPLKTAELAEHMTRIYKALAHKNQVSRIEITEDGSTIIRSQTGKSINFDRSAGENQLFATALIAGLAHVSGIRAPLVVDTPLGRLDSKHRHNILDFWTSDKTRQVVLLSQDKEIDTQLYKRIESSVSTTYLLEHQDVGDGIGRTTASSGRYF